MDVSGTSQDEDSTGGEVIKQVRAEYRQYRHELIENRVECIDPNSNLIENILDKVERTFKSVKNPREAVSDSHVLHELALLGTERIKNLKCAFRSFNNNEFMEKLIIYIDENSSASKTEPIVHEEQEEDFLSDDESMRTQRRRSSQRKTSNYVLTQPVVESFGTSVMSYFRVMPRPKFLLGSLDKQVVLGKKQIVRQRREKRDDEAVRTKIKELDIDSKENETNNTVGETERIYKLLTKYYKKTKGNPICLYEFMINPHSFSRTIENIFYISFLVKDGFATIYLDDEELPVIAPIEDTVRAKTQTPENKKINVQSMISLNKRQWQELIKVFEIESAIITDPKR